MIGKWLFCSCVISVYCVSYCRSPVRSRSRSRSVSAEKKSPSRSRSRSRSPTRSRSPSPRRDSRSRSRSADRDDDEDKAEQWLDDSWECVPCWDCRDANEAFFEKWCAVLYCCAPCGVATCACACIVKCTLGPESKWESTGVVTMPVLHCY